MSLTDAQARAAHAAGSVAVVAGAGSGKTHMLVARFLHHLEAHGLSPLEVVAVTFTEKAATELRARVRRGVQSARPDDFEALAELEAAPIGTLHALCGRIVRDHPRSAGVRADARVIDEQERAAWLDEHFALALAALPPRLFTRLPYSRLSEVLRALLGDPLTAQRAFAVGGESWSVWAAQARRDAAHALTSEPTWREALRTLQAVLGEEGDRVEDARRTALDSARRLLDDPSTHAEVLRTLDLRGGSAKAWPDGALASVKDALKTIKALATDRGDLTLQVGVGDAWWQEALPDVREAFEGVQAELSARKQREGLLDFADLEVHALHALQDEQVRAHYARRWKAFLIDEAQDVNPVQDEILRHLYATARLTVVGDEKQSIYGFRRADVDTFRRARTAVTAEGGEEVALDVSFRTHARLVDACNAVFAPLLGDLHAPLRAARPSSTAVFPIEAHVVDGEESTAEQRRLEAHLVARRVSALLDEGLLVEDRDGPREARPGDVAVLTRTWAALPAIGAALAAHGVPVVAAGSGSLLDTTPARDVVNLLTAVALHDDVALIAVLRSPWCGLSDTTLHTMHRARGERPWLDALAACTDPLARRASEFLRTLEAHRRSWSPSRLVQLADRLGGYSAVLAHLPDAERRLADWRGTLDLLRELERGEEDVFLVVRRLREYLQAGWNVKRPAVASGNAVTLSTMHGAKGLEWPIVVVADLAWTPTSDAPSVLFSPTFGVACRPEGSETELPVPYALQSTLAARREDAEARRLLYVALTRARDHLVLTASKRPPRSLFALLEPGLEAAGVDVQRVVADADDERDASPSASPAPVPSDD
ncbi:UvrD-helicase domain-containing protein [Deinococcus yavapaiensis]|uniref:DNA 3'-5' helicase n=1 Tax=Deinococcus yavapaiensis KR-236 TaxID=694435 RepID=A0A318S7I0_9DEIO|nr:UvrD-helicase domain-containing protein [Deinococcus yavapaiensis]PYE53856.1 ATP-dependent helicase/nuclease subunit A [Deinococcus yavapaiensis KR-236]